MGLEIIVLISGEGTTLQHLIDYSIENPDVFTIKSVGTDRPCNGRHRALKANIPLIDWKNIYSQEVDLICLAGFLRKIHIPKHWEYKVINIHPALLPGLGGKGFYGINVHRAIHQSKAWYTGCTVHLCDNEYDHGPILYQEVVSIEPDWSPDTISIAVQKVEKEAYIKVLKAISDIYKEGYNLDDIVNFNYLRKKLS